MPHSIEEIHDALIRIHSVAIGKSDRAYMSIPPDRDRDADFILSDAIKELAELRTTVSTLTADRDELRGALSARNLELNEARAERDRLASETARYAEQQAMNVANEQELRRECEKLQAFKSWVQGCWVSPQICRECANDEQVKAICKKHAAKITPIIKRRTEELELLKLSKKIPNFD